MGRSFFIAGGIWAAGKIADSLSMGAWRQIELQVVDTLLVVDYRRLVLDWLFVKAYNFAG